MTDRLDQIEADNNTAHDRGWADDQQAMHDISWLIAELRETRRLGNQLANDLSVAIGAEVVNSPALADRHWATVAAWRDHRKGTAE